MRRLFAFHSRLLRLVPALLTLGWLLVGCGAATSAPAASLRPTSTPQLREMRSVTTPATRTYLGTVSRTRALLGIVPTERGCAPMCVMARPAASPSFPSG